jgi:hypothetical protein
MKTTLTYGIALAIASGVLTLILYIVGLMDAEHMGTGIIIAIIALITIDIICLVLGMKDARAQLDPAAGFSYLLLQVHQP